MNTIDKMFNLLLDKVVGQIRHRYDNEHEEQGALIMMCHMQATMKPLIEQVKAEMAELKDKLVKCESHMDLIARNNNQNLKTIADLKCGKAIIKVENDKLKATIKGMSVEWQKTDKHYQDKLSRRNTLICDLRGQVNKYKERACDMFDMCDTFKQ